ncbi:hypothetical protein TNCV_1146421 [Trichonephila clavipes]|nr:hypothetical protein TNCV_1146421 [Trichonephila clavipes]
MTGKDILECVQSSKSIIDTDSDDENASPVLESSEMRNIMKKEKETPNSTTLSKKIAQGNLTASCKRLISWFLLYKGTEMGRKIVPVRPPKF